MKYISYLYINNIFGIIIPTYSTRYIYMMKYISRIYMNTILGIYNNTHIFHAIGIYIAISIIYWISSNKNTD